ncbi:MAG: energy-coupling factor transporter ATPase [Bacilli bacterium]|nr:energy-coupling factor transporter ATPase [Bacilli bacterium]
MAIKVKDLFYTYLPKTPNETVALKGISLTIEEHSFTAFLGETGSGKSTLMQNLNALLIPSKGEIEVDNFVITPKKHKNKQIKQLRKHVGLVFQFPEYQLFEETVVKDVAFGVRNFGASKEVAIEKAKKALLSVGIDESYFSRSPLELSGGEKRRVAIAGILAIEPDILVLDEPTAGLDPKGAEEVMSLVKKMNESGTTIVLVSHDMELVMKYASKVFVLHEGKLVFEGTPNLLFSHVDEGMSIEIPPVYLLANKLKEKGVPLDIENIRDIDDLTKQIADWRKDD